ncbi:hypothetical protein ACFYKT_04160 [Cytobacillus sp. FJAT-53684]|uniref:Uncharacterized protein n=1 Tax=Cytobacillus mangrovibacter TaxID=3299024 RepID=A0ABW6JUQ3_9BACI
MKIINTVPYFIEYYNPSEQFLKEGISVKRANEKLLSRLLGGNKLMEINLIGTQRGAFLHGRICL